MKDRAVALVLVGLCACPVGGCGNRSRAADPPAGSARRIEAIERETSERWKRHDVAFFEALLAPDVVLTQFDGTLQTRADLLGELRSDYQVDQALMEDLVVHVHGSTAVATGRCHNTGLFAGARFDTRYRFVDTFHWDGGQWRLIAWANVRFPGATTPGAGTAQ